LSVEQDLDARLPRRAHDAPLGVEAHAGERHVLVPRHLTEDIPEIRRRGKDQMRRGADRVSHLERVLPFVQLRILVARGESVELIPQRRCRIRLLPPDLADQSYNRGGVEATAQATARSYIADQMGAGCIQQHVAQRGYPHTVVNDLAEGLRIGLPVAPAGDLAAGYVDG
jgi:hypothetical protein